MSQDFLERTEAPTARRRADARRQGQIPRSGDLVAVAMLMGSLMLLDRYGPGLAAALRSLLAQTLSPAALGDSRPATLSSLGPVAAAMAPLLAGTLVIAVLANVAQVGLTFNARRLRPDGSFFHPLRRNGGAMQLAMNMLKLLLAALAAWTAVRGRLGEIVSIQRVPFTGTLGLCAGLLYSTGVRIGLALLALAVADYAWRKWRIEQQLKMTRQEVKEEMRQMEGDPQVRLRRRQIVQQWAVQQLMRDVPGSDVVVIDPGQIAVALKYDPDQASAPRLVAKGQGLVAQRIRQSAALHGVPIVERTPLAVALFRRVGAGQEVPEKFHPAVAEILAYVYAADPRRAGGPGLAVG